MKPLHVGAHCMRPSSRSFMKMYMSLMLVFAIMCAPLSAVAAQLSFTPTTGNFGTVSLKMPIQKIGSVEIPRGRIAIKGNTIEVTMIPEWMFDRQVALSGPVLRAVSSVTDSRSVVVGIAYFQEGPWLKYIDDPNRPDTVVTSNGTLTGKIVSADNDAITFEHDGKQESIPIANLHDVRSPRAYTFTIPASLAATVPAGSAYQAEATGFVLRPTSNSYKLAALKNDLAKESGDWSTSKIVLLGAAFTGMQLAQLTIPLVYALDQRYLKQNAAAVQRNFSTDQGVFGPSIQYAPYPQINQSYTMP